ncbi:hypothetical protein GWI33_014777 [Rhynchophorus ferrugineus]|uniref:HEAT repeat-containing protein 6 n=1 Tax=Rhynchophorus ferrugineus TaxID=354439 RepID=A0A834MC12_RHYFE|nr:hypothetical protein GWI33_014777 [Rhynchophorus ferrugineus]
MESSQTFDHLSVRIGQLRFSRTEGERHIISQILDELNSINYRYPIIGNPTKAVLLVNQCCTIIPFDDVLLVPKCCQLLNSLVKNQNIRITGRTLIVSIQWCLEALKNNPKQTAPDILRVLDSLLRNNVQNVLIILDRVIAEVSLEGQKTENEETSLIALQCLEACTAFSNENKSDKNIEKFFVYFEKCAAIFISFLCKVKPDTSSVFYNKMLETCLIGLRNIVILHQDYLHIELGLILGIVKTYMLYNIKDLSHLPVKNLKPSTLTLPELPSAIAREKSGGKITKQRKPIPSGSNNRKKERPKRNGDLAEVSPNSSYTPATLSLDYNSDNGGGNSPFSLLNTRLKTSDSDFSDNEAGNLAKLNRSFGKIRQAALDLLYNTIKHTEKPVMFSYWTSFIPDTSSLNKHNLITCILKEASVRGRMYALNALLLLLTSSKLYLIQAESSEKSVSFTPFSVELGLSLIELHRSLSIALVYQISVPVLALVLKCMAALVQATPYHRMNTGLVTDIIRNVKSLIYHRDASVQVTALIVLGCILAFEPAVPETLQSMTTLEWYSRAKAERTGSDATVSSTRTPTQETEDFDYAQFSSDDEESDREVGQVPWLLHKCLRNLGVKIDQNERAAKTDHPERVVPAPVKLESLQIISAMSRNYFDSLMLPHVGLITRALEMSLVDRYIDLRLHAGRAVDFLGQAIGRLAESDGSLTCLDFWQALLDGPLVSLLQNEQQHALRAVGCDCIGSIGPYIFQQLPRDKQILCVTLLFACARDEEHSVRGAAVRALALCVLYPSLREDPGFVVDTAESILTSLKDENLTVRIKASWSLGNLSDALVLNNKSNEPPAEDRLPESVLFDLFEESIKCSRDCDKIKTNIVRALGNLLQLANHCLLKQERFRLVCERALDTLVQATSSGSHMKVRWNACYALGNALKNPCLYDELSENMWQSSVFTTLTELVVNFKNFKVRINAALALASPNSRSHYGPYFVPIWTYLLKALENSQHMDNFTEYKHRDNLIEQICLTLGHLTALLTMQDLTSLENTIALYYDLLRAHMLRVLERLVPEKSTELSSAACYLDSLENSCGDNKKDVIRSLKTIFSHSVI